MPAAPASAPVTAVVFDIGRVLYQWDRRFLFEKLIDDPAELERVLDEVVTLEWHSQHDAGRPLAEMVAERVAIFPAERALIETYVERWLDTIPGPVESMHDLVEQLDARGVPLFAITNFGHEFWQLFRPTAPIFDRFRDIVVSGTERLMKPDEAIYRLAERRFGVPAAQCLFIDDSLANVEAARACGYRAHHFIHADGVRAELEALGLIAPVAA